MERSPWLEQGIPWNWLSCSTLFNIFIIVVERSFNLSWQNLQVAWSLIVFPDRFDTDWCGSRRYKVTIKQNVSQCSKMQDNPPGNKGSMLYLQVGRLLKSNGSEQDLEVTGDNCLNMSSQSKAVAKRLPWTLEVQKPRSWVSVYSAPSIAAQFWGQCRCPHITKDVKLLERDQKIPHTKKNHPAAGK